MTLQNNIKYIQQTKTYMVSCVQIHQTIMNTSKQIKTQNKQNTPQHQNKTRHHKHAGPANR